MHALPVSKNRYGNTEIGRVNARAAHQNKKEGEWVIFVSFARIPDRLNPRILQKCDAKRPCTTCTLAKNSPECVYDGEGDTKSGGIYPSYKMDGHLLDPLDLSPAASTASSSLFPTTLSQSWIPFSFLGEGRLWAQFSEADATDLDMRSCVLEQESSATNSHSDISRLWVAPRLIKLGVKFSRKKLDAFLRGDQSGTVLNRAFVCGSHVLGMLFSTDVDDTPPMVQFHARRAQTAWECLIEVFNGNDYGVKVQAAMMIAAGYILIRMPQMSILYIQKSCDFIKAGNMQFVPTYGRPPDFSEDLHENLVALSQTIYWANYLFLMHGGPEPHATAKLEKEFQRELLVSHVTSILYIGLIFYNSKLTRFSLRSVL